MAQIAMHLDAVSMFVKQIGETTAVAEVLKQQKLHFEQTMSETSLALGDAEKICTALRSIPWPQETLDAMLTLVARKTLAAGGSSSAGRCKLQDYIHIVHYWTKEHWAF